MKDFDFCPFSRVVKEVAPDEKGVVSFNGWDFSSRPTTPYRRSFSVTLHGMYWWANSDNNIDSAVNPTTNALRLMEFYKDHRLHGVFTFDHEYLGPIHCRFKTPVNIEPAIPNSNGLISAFEVMLIHHNPKF